MGRDGGDGGGWRLESWTLWKGAGERRALEVKPGESAFVGCCEEYGGGGLVGQGREVWSDE